MMSKICIHLNCAVCENIEQRDIFKSILKILYPEVYICKYAVYQIANENGKKFTIPSLDSLSKGKLGYFIEDIYTSKIIFLNKDNFEVVCTQKECISKPYVAEYTTKQHEKAAE